jgi:hypothetical protein
MIKTKVGRKKKDADLRASRPAAPWRFFMRLRTLKQKSGNPGNSNYRRALAAHSRKLLAIGRQAVWIVL